MSPKHDQPIAAEEKGDLANPATPTVKKVTFSTATKTIMEALGIQSISAGPLTGELIEEYIQLVDKVGSLRTGLSDCLDEALDKGGGNGPEQLVLQVLKTADMSNEAGSRMLIDPILLFGTMLYHNLTGKRMKLKPELILADSEEKGERGGPVEITARNGEVYSFTGKVDYAIWRLEGIGDGTAVKKLADIVCEDPGDLHMFIVEAKHSMTETELKSHFPQLTTQAMATMKITGSKALACILTDGFQYIFGVMENVDEASEQHVFYYYDGLHWIDDGVPDKDKGKQLLVMTMCWGILDPKTQLAEEMRYHIDSIQS
ncbi:hypothetical protein CC2G_012456 [Coprinopsis cinerea AmutBmut pab1-1]|nr:hypothetical protein CC2G_012456 [Coprinopsis cinerea AmutBmut pab1-1]